MAQNQISEAQRAQNFAAATRQNLHMLPARTVNNYGETVQFTFPKSRLLSKTFVKVDVKGDFTNKKTSGYKPYEILRRVSLSLNNGFEPFVISGRDLAIMNSVRMNPAVINTNTNGMVISSTDRNNTVLDNRIELADDGYSFVIELENVLSQRGLEGLILLQNESTQVTLSIDIATNGKGITDEGTDITLESIKITPMLQTWTIPNFTDAFPNLSVIKLVKSRTETLANAGEHILKLDVGTIYRKLVFFFTDENGNGVDIVNSNIEMIYNTADTPISIDPDMLIFKNTSDFGYKFPKGMYVLDFSGYAGMSGLGTTRDMIDTERLTEFWIRFSTSDGCKVTTIQENIARLRA